jgi:hypothetical protein
MGTERHGNGFFVVGRLSGLEPVIVRNWGRLETFGHSMDPSDSRYVRVLIDCPGITTKGMTLERFVASSGEASKENEAATGEPLYETNPLLLKLQALGRCRVSVKVKVWPDGTGRYVNFTPTSVRQLPDDPDEVMNFAPRYLLDEAGVKVDTGATVGVRATKPPASVVKHPAAASWWN